MKRNFERISDFLSLLWGWVPAVLAFTLLFCIPSLIHIIGFTKIAFISFIVLMVLTSVLIVYSLIKFVLASQDDDVAMMNRCVDTWIIFGVPAIVGILVAKFVDIF